MRSFDERLLILKSAGAALHRAVYVFQSLRRLVWYVTKPRSSGVHAVAITPAGKLVLVTLSYASGWRLPGGGLKAGEDAEAAMLRELREEIGLLSWQSMRRVADFEHRPDFRRGSSVLFVVTGVIYRPRWSLEIKRAAEFAPDRLPPDLAPITQRLLEAASDLVSPG